MATHQTDETVFDKGILTVSIDFELLWGTLDRKCRGRFRKWCRIEREQVIDRLIGLFEKHRIRATWGVVGSLFLEDRGGETDSSLLHGSDLIEKIRRCGVPQEIGSHTFSHTMLGDSRCTEEIARREFSEATRVACAAGIEMRSLIFPRNKVGHLGLAKQFGFTCFRGPEPHWYRSQPRAVRRAGHLLEIFAARTPPSVVPEYDREGLWNIPGSMLYTPSFGSRRFVPVWLRVARAKKGLAEAVRRKRIFHLWFHPTDLACRMEAMLDGLDSIFGEAARLRDDGQLNVLSMQDLARREEMANEIEEEPCVR